jgi:transposase
MYASQGGSSIMAIEITNVIVGVDTHADTHHVALINEYGKHLADKKFLATGSGYRGIIAFATSYGPVLAAGLEGTGSYGAELARVMARAGFQVIEVNRPNRQARRLHGKSDPLDAYQAAEAVLAKRGTSMPKTRDGYVEALRVIQAGRTSALKARTALICQIKSILITATEGLRAKYRPLTTAALIKALAASRPVGLEADPVTATAATLKKLAQRHHHLTVEIIDADARLKRIIATHAPALTAITGIGTIVATQLLVTMGDNPDRCTSEAQFAALTGTAPIPASSGKTIRHRLSRGGDRAANAAIHHIALVRMSTDQRTKNYVIKRTAEGKSKREILRCLIGQVLNLRPGQVPGRGSSVVSGDGLVAVPS